MRILCFVITVLLVFIAYSWTSAPGIGLVDSGELTTAAWCLGIAHPTGYPLYTLLGHIWQALLPWAVDRSMVLFSAAAAALACGALTLITLSQLGKRAELSGKQAAVLSVILTMGFAFSSAALGAISFAEVYPLTVLLVALMIWQATKIEENVLDSSRRALLIGYLWGLGLGNHLTILWFFPVVLFAVLRTKGAFRGMVACGASIALGASINLYLPIRSAAEPLLNWGHPDSLARLVRHLSGWQYQVWMFRDSAGAFVQKLLVYLGSIPADIGWGLFLLVLIGISGALLRKSWLAASLIASWMLGTIYNMNYSIPDISTYFLTFYVPLFVLAAGGFVVLAEILLRVVKEGALRNSILFIMALIVPAASMAALPGDAVQHSNRFARNLAAELLHTLPDSALVIQADWDIQSPCIYLQNVEGVRRDVVMLDLNLMQRSWYVREQAQQHPDAFAGSEDEIANFLKAVAPFEEQKPFQSQQIEAAFVALNNGLIRHGLNVRPVYLRDAAATGHPGVGANFPRKAGAFFSRISSTAIHDPVLNPVVIMSRRSDFSEREQRLIDQVVQAIILQGRAAMVAEDALQVQTAVAAAQQLARDEAGVSAFLKDANTFLNKVREPHL